MNPRRFPIWPAFDQGEVSPLADGRVDSAGYFRSCDTVRNMICRIQGPAERRTGSYHVAGAIDQAVAGRLIPFKYSADVSFALELGDYSMRFFYLGAPVVAPELVVNGGMEADSDWYDHGTPTVNARSDAQAHGGDYARMFTVDAAQEGIQCDDWTTAAAGDLMASLFVYSDDSDAVLIRVRRGDNSGWAFEQTFPIIRDVWNWIHFTWTETAPGGLGYVAALSPAGVTSGTWYVDDVTVRPIYQIVTPWAAADLALLKYRQVANAMYLVHPDYPVQKLVRTATVNWSLSEVDFAWGPFLDQNTSAVTISPDATTGSGIELTASGNLFEAGHVGALFALSHDAQVSDVFASDTTGTDVTLQAGESFVVSLSGTWSATMYLARSYDGGSTWVDYAAYTANMSVELVNLEDDVMWRWRMASFASGSCTARIVLRDKKGYCKITAVNSATSADADVIEDFWATTATAKWSEGAFSPLRGYPRALSFFEGRLVLAGTAHHPSELYGSRVDDYESHETGIDDDDAWSYILAGAEVNDIAWMLDGDILHIGTAGDEWRFGDASAATTPTFVNARRQTQYGSVLTLEAIKAGDTIIFVEDGGRSIRAVFYNYERDTYIAEALSDKAEHLFSQSTIAGQCFTARPVPMLWFCLADGSLRSASFDLQNKIVAFASHALGGDGAVESMCVLRGPYHDELWLLVRRTIDGQTVRHIEVVWPRSWTDKADAYYVDAGLSFYAAAPTRYFTGLYHLEGETVQVLADGAVHAPVTVQDGAVSLEYAVTTVHLGLGYVSELAPKRLEIQTGGGDTCQSRRLVFPQARIRLMDAMACKVGSSAANADSVTFRTTLTPLGQSPDLFSGDVLANVHGGGENGRISIVCNQPVPLVVVAIMPLALLSTDN